MAQKPNILDQKFKSNVWEIQENSTIAIDKKSLLVPKFFGLTSLMLSDVKFKNMFVNKDSTDNVFSMILTNNTIQMQTDNPYGLRLEKPFLLKGFSLKIHKNRFLGAQFNLDGTFGSLDADSNQGDFWFDRLKVLRELELNYNMGSVRSSGSNIHSFSFFHQKSKTDSIHLTFQRDTLRRFRITDSEIRKIKIDFEECYFPSFVSIESRNDVGGFTERDLLKFYAASSLNIVFLRCKLNGLIASEGCRYRSKVVFNEVQFGANARIDELSYDTLIFRNCNQFEGSLQLTLDTTNKPVYLSFVNTDVSKLDLFFSDRIRIFFDANILADQITNTYENLLAKYKLEGKLESYKNVDIQYTHYKNSKFGVLGAIFSFMDKYWWYYGYNKEFIFLWTLGFLALFYALNLFLWNQMQSLYPVVPDSRQRNSNRPYTAARVNHWISVFVYTAFIFFSLRVEFNKISYHRNRYIILFFAQYIVGLISMFFIANAIFTFR